jgi:hypothetical protein
MSMKKILLPIGILSFAFIAQAQNVGIGTTSPAARLHVTDSSVLFSAPGNVVFTAGDPPISGPGRRMMWYPGKAAFRVGYAFHTEWDKDSIGAYSFAAGVEVKAKGSYSFAMGSSSSATGFVSFALGNGAKSSGDASAAIGIASVASGTLAFSIGEATVASGVESLAIGIHAAASQYQASSIGINTLAEAPFSTAVGYFSRASGNASFALGHNTIAKSYGGTVVGAYNDAANPYDYYNFHPNNRIFQVGNGTAENTRSNALTILQNGNVGIGELYPEVPLHFSSVTGNKINLFRVGSNAYGFGVQDFLLQLYTDNWFSDIAFGYGNSNSFTETMRIKGNGFVGIGETNPIVPLNFPSFTGNKISLSGNGINHCGFGIQPGLMQVYADVAASDIAFGYGSSTSFTERMRIKGNGNVGIGVTNPIVPLNFSSSTGNKISLSGTGANHCGFGIQPGLMQVYADVAASDIAFGYGSSTSFTERMRIKGNGNVGIGETNPTVLLNLPATLGNKISFYGNGTNHYGLGIQPFLLQIYTPDFISDIAFGYGNSNSFTEIMRIKGNNSVAVQGNFSSTGNIATNGTVTVQNGKGIIRNTGTQLLKKVTTLVTVSTTIDNSTAATLNFNFSETFTALPEAYVGNIVTNTSNGEVIVKSVGNLTSTGGTLFLYNPRGGSGFSNVSFTINIIAIGP